MMLDLPTADAEALLRHALSFKPDSGDAHEDARLTEALEALAETLSEQVPWVG